MKKTTADIMVDALIAHGVDTMFGIPGAHCYELSDALARRSNDIRFVHSRMSRGRATWPTVMQSQRASLVSSPSYRGRAS